MNAQTPDTGSIVLVQYVGLTPSTTLSPPCGKVHMALAFKGLEYEVLNLNSPTQVKKFNPRGRLPALSFAGEIFVDSSDIVSEIDRRFPDPPLLPNEAALRARAMILEDWADEVLYFYDVWLRWCDPENAARMRREVLAKMPVPFRWIVPPLAFREVRRRAKGQGIGLKPADAVRREYRQCLDNLVDLLRESEYLVGDRITRADLATCAVIDQLRLPLLTPDAAAEIEKRREIVDWLARVHRIAPNAATDGA